MLHLAAFATLLGAEEETFVVSKAADAWHPSILPQFGQSGRLAYNDGGYLVYIVNLFYKKPRRDGTRRPKTNSFSLPEVYARQHGWGRQTPGKPGKLSLGVQHVYTALLLHHSGVRMMAPGRFREPDDDNAKALSNRALDAVTACEALRLMCAFDNTEYALFEPALIARLLYSPQDVPPTPDEFKAMETAAFTLRKDLVAAGLIWWTKPPTGKCCRYKVLAPDDGDEVR